MLSKSTNKKVIKKDKLLPLRYFVRQGLYNADYLYILVKRKKLKAKRLGRNFYTTQEWFDSYMELHARGEKRDSFTQGDLSSLEDNKSGEAIIKEQISGLSPQAEEAAYMVSPDSVKPAKAGAGEKSVKALKPEEHNLAEILEDKITAVSARLTVNSVKPENKISAAWSDNIKREEKELKTAAKLAAKEIRVKSEILAGSGGEGIKKIKAGKDKIIRALKNFLVLFSFAPKKIYRLRFLKTAASAAAVFLILLAAARLMPQASVDLNLTASRGLNKLSGVVVPGKPLAENIKVSLDDLFVRLVDKTAGASLSLENNIAHRNQILARRLSTLKNQAPAIAGFWQEEFGVKLKSGAVAKLLPGQAVSLGQSSLAILKSFVNFQGESAGELARLAREGQTKGRVAGVSEASDSSAPMPRLLALANTTSRRGREILGQAKYNTAAALENTADKQRRLSLSLGQRLAKLTLAGAKGAGSVSDSGQQKLAQLGETINQTNNSIKQAGESIQEYNDNGQKYLAKEAGRSLWSLGDLYSKFIDKILPQSLKNKYAKYYETPPAAIEKEIIRETRIVQAGTPGAITQQDSIGRSGQSVGALSGITDKDLSITGNADIGGYLNVSGPVALKNKLTVIGQSEFLGEVVVNAALTAKTLLVTDYAQFAGTVNAKAIAADDITIRNNLTVVGGSFIGGDELIAGNLKVSGTFSAGHTEFPSLGVTGAVGAQSVSAGTGGLTVDGSSYLSGAVTLTDVLDIDIESASALTVGDGSTDTFTVDTSSGIVTIAAALNLNGDLNLTGNTQFNGKLDLNGSLDLDTASTSALAVGDGVNDNLNIDTLNDIITLGYSSTTDQINVNARQLALNSASSTTALFINYDGTGNIIQIFDNATARFTLADNGNISQTASTTGYAYTLNQAGTNGNLLNVQDQGISRFTIADNGITNLTASSTTGTALTITQNDTGDILNLYDGAAEILTVLDGGYVGIGTTTPGYKFSVAGSAYFDGTVIASGFTATSSISAPYFTATSATATSTFAGGFSAASSLYVLQGGSVGIGIAGPEAVFHVSPNGSGGDSVYNIVENGVTYRVHKFTTTGAATFTPPPGVSSVEYLVVAGGGNGAEGCGSGGGGGAGGYLAGSTSVTSQSYAVTVGAATRNSVFSSVAATGGGSAIAYGNGQNGGSGGGVMGASPYTPGTGIPGQGYDGALGTGIVGVNNITGGGGGGSGSAGSTGSGHAGGAGGTGTVNSITGSAITYAAGGHGADFGAYTGIPGPANTGNGGSGLTSGGCNYGIVAGGSGIVVVRYRLPNAAVFAGNVGIGTTSPWGLLSVNANGLVAGTPQFVVGSSTATNFIVANNGYVGIGTTSPSSALAITGNGYFTGNLAMDGTSGLSLNGPGAGLTFYGTGNHDITATGGTLRIGSNTIIGNIQALDDTVDIGTPATRFDKIYANEVNATTLVGTLTGGNLIAETFRINSDNVTDDTEDSFLTFERGNTTPNAELAWGSTQKRFDLNQAIFIQDDSHTAATSTLLVQGWPGQTTDIFRVASSSAETNVYLNVNSSGLVGIGTTSPWGLLSVNANGLVSGTPQFVVGSSTATNFIVANGGNVGIGTVVPYGMLTIQAPVANPITTNYVANFYTPGNDAGDGSKIGFSFGNSPSHLMGAAIGALNAAGQGKSLVFYTGPGNSSPGSEIERVRIVSSGLVGIGTTDPAAQFHASSTSFVSGIFDQRGTSDILQLQDAGTSVFVVKDGGNVGIGTTSPYSLLSISNNLNTAANTPLFTIASTTAGTATSTLLTVLANGNVGIGTSSPGANLHIARTDSGLPGTGVSYSALKFTNTRWDTSNDSSIVRIIDVPSIFSPAGDNGGNMYNNGNDLRVFDIQDVSRSALNYYAAPFYGYRIGDISVGGPYNGASTYGFYLKSINGGAGIDVGPDPYIPYNYGAYIGDVYGGVSVSRGIHIAGGSGAAKYKYGLSIGDITGGTADNYSIYSGGGKSYFAGNVGIGTTTPMSLLSVAGTITTNNINATSTTATSTFSGGFTAGNNAALTVNMAAPANSLYIAPGGNVGIGTTNPGAKLQINDGNVAGGTDAQLAIYGGQVNSPGSEYANLFFGEMSASGNSGTKISATLGADNLRSQLAFYTSARSGNNSILTEQMRISDDGLVTMAQNLVVSGTGNTTIAGNVGIGTTTPNWLLQVSGTRPSLALSDYSSAADKKHWLLSSMGGNMYIGTSTDAYATSTPPALTILNNGNVGIGMANPTQKLDVAGDIRRYGTSGTLAIEVGSLDNVAWSGEGLLLDYNFTTHQGDITAVEASVGYKTLAFTGLDQRFLTGSNSVTEAMRITTAGNVGVGSTTPWGLLSVNANGLVAGTPQFVVGSSTATNFIVANNGNVGIGTMSPTHKLEVSGDIDYVNDVGPGIGQFAITGATNSTNRLVLGYDTTDNYGFIAAATYGSTWRNLVLQPDGGFVGIGKFGPRVRLEIKGDIAAPTALSAAVSAGALILGDSGSIGAVFGQTSGSGSDYPTYIQARNLGANSLAYSLSLNPLGGNVGIGTTTPNSILSLYQAAADSGITFGDTLTTRFIMGTDYSDSSKLKVSFGSALGTNDLITITGEQTSFQTPTSFEAAGDVSMAYDLLFQNPTASYIKSVAPLYLESGEQFNSSDLTLRTFNSGNIILDAGNTGGTIAQASSTAAALTVTQNGITSPGPIATFFASSTEVMRITSSGIATPLVGIGTTTPWGMLSLNASGLPSGTPQFVIGSSTATNFIVANNGNVGIGTSSPLTKLSIQGTAGANDLFNVASSTGASLMYINAAGNVGIGTTSPGYKLDVNGIVNATALYVNGAPYVGSQWTTLNSDIYYTAGNVGLGTSSPASLFNLASAANTRLTLSDTNATLKHWFIESNDSSFSIGTTSDALATNATYRALTINSNGNVGVGTTSPGYKLDVNGIVNATALYVNGAPYVGSQWTTLNSDIYYTAGNVGIGTTTPAYKLTINSSNGTDNLFQISTTTNQGIMTVNNAGNVGINTATPSYALDVAGSAAFGTGAEAMRIDSTGNVGIGTSSPYATLSVVNNTANLVDVFAISTSSSGIIFKVDSYGRTYGDGAYSSPAADYAEYFYTNSTDLKSGETVCVDIVANNAIKRCERGADNNVMGIVSTKPSVIGNYIKAAETNPSHYAIIGMLGQVDAFVSAENGEINIGDSLTSASSTPGYAMRADGGDSTVGIALEPLKTGTGKIKVLISRRNKSLAVEEVEALVVERIANMKIEDRVQQLITDAVTNLNLDPKIVEIAKSEAGKLDAALTVRLDIVNGGITNLNNEILSLRSATLQNDSEIIALQLAMFQNDNLMASTTALMENIKIDENGNIVIGQTSPQPSPYQGGESTVQIVDITEITASSTQTALVVNQQGEGDVADFQSGGVSVMNIDSSGQVKIVGSMLVDGRIMLCTGGNCSDALDSATDATMADLGVEGKVVAGAFEGYCDTGYVWVPGSAKYGTLPGFCVQQDLANQVNISQGQAQVACQTLGTGYHLLGENEWLTIAENILKVADNDTDSLTEGMQLGSPASYKLTNDNIINNLSGEIAEWTNQNVTSAGLPIAPSNGAWYEYGDVSDYKGLNIAPDYYLTDADNNIGKIYAGSGTGLRGFVRGQGGIYSLDLSHSPSEQSETIGFRCAK